MNDNIDDNILLFILVSVILCSVPRAKLLGFYSLLGKHVLICSFTNLANYMVHITIFPSWTYFDFPLFTPPVALVACPFYVNNAPSISLPLYYPPQTLCYIPSGFPYCIIFTQPCSIRLPVKPVSFTNISWLLNISKFLTWGVIDFCTGMCNY